MKLSMLSTNKVIILTLTGVLALILSAENSFCQNTWKCATDKADFSERMGFGFLTFQDKMWVLSGENTLGVGDSNSECTDIWYSTNGANWTKAANPSYSGRSQFSSLVYNENMWVIGGMKAC